MTSFNDTEIMVLRAAEAILKSKMTKDVLSISVDVSRDFSGGGFTHVRGCCWTGDGESATDAVVDSYQQALAALKER